MIDRVEVGGCKFSNEENENSVADSEHENDSKDVKQQDAENGANCQSLVGE